MSVQHHLTSSTNASSFFLPTYPIILNLHVALVFPCLKYEDSVQVIRWLFDLVSICIYTSGATQAFTIKMFDNIL